MNVQTYRGQGHNVLVGWNVHFHSECVHVVYLCRPVSSSGNFMVDKKTVPQGSVCVFACSTE